MDAPNYRISYANKSKNKIFIIVMLVILLLIVFRPLSWIRKTLAIKSMEYKTTHDPVYFSSLNFETSGIPMVGTILRNFSDTGKGIDIKPTSLPTKIRAVDIGMIMEIGYQESTKNYIKIRHVSESKKDIYYTYYSNLPARPNLKVHDWVGTSTILYDGDLDFLHFEVTDFDENQLDPSSYIHLTDQ